MGRKRNNFTAATQARILALMGQGGTAESIAATLTGEGVGGASRATVGRRIRELQGLNAPRGGGASPSPAPPSAPSSGTSGEPALPASPDEIPPGTGLETFDVWLARAERMAKDAEGKNNLTDLGKAGRLVSMLIEAKRKATPIPKPDPNDNPDMIEMGARVAKELHRLVDLVVLP